MTKLILATLTAVGATIVVATVLAREPSEPLAVAAVVLGAALFAGALTSLLALRLEERAARRLRHAHRARALRRGTAVGVVLAALTLLRAADGLTLVTGAFVVGGFALAELVLALPGASTH